MFPQTRHSVIAAAGAGDTEGRRTAFGTCVEVYWHPVCSYLRLRWRASAEESEELTQGFFARAFEKNFFEAYDPARARFRTFLRTCVDGFVANERQAAARLKRGGAVRPLSLDELADAQEPGLSVTQDFDRHFEREWARSVLSIAIQRLREAATTDTRARQLAAFTRYDVDADDGASRPTYAALGAELGMSVSEVTNALFAARRDFRTQVLECLRELTRTEDEFQAEARRLLGIEVS
jgi:DNA-directed RNA polymerase specialized sigma24 family protein